MITRLHGICFADLPYISKGDMAVISREKGELWDSDARPAYSVRLDGLHIGYIPLVETLKEEALKARNSNLKKKWKDEYQNLTPYQLRNIALSLNERGELEHFHDWEEVPEDKARQIAKRKFEECEVVYVVRDFLYVEMNYNHLTPMCRLIPGYYDEREGFNWDEIGEICSISADIDVDGLANNELGTQTSASMAATEAMRHDQT